MSNTQIKILTELGCEALNYRRFNSKQHWVIKGGKQC